MASSTPVAASSGTSIKPKLSLAQIFFMSFGFLGIQFGFALQKGNTSRILRSFGADVEQLPMFWIVAPLVGMIVQPLIGHYSDRTWNRLGRRKPYFLTGALLSSAALIFLPNSGAVSSIQREFLHPTAADEPANAKNRSSRGKQAGRFRHRGDRRREDARRGVGEREPVDE